MLTQRLFTGLAALVITATASAMPAHPAPARVAQPDGDSITVKLVGDEFFHYTTTADGYTVLQDRNGWFTYATKQNGRLVSTGVVARDTRRRTPSDISLLASLGRQLTDQESIHTGKARRASRDARIVSSRRAPEDWAGFRGLVILIQFTDKKFQRSDAQEFYTDMLNTRGYTGYSTSGRWGSTQFVQCTGSMRDYFYENSMGQFDPEFDVVGPINVNYSCKQAGNEYDSVFEEALNAVDDQVNFADYDSDGDGYLDMVYFIVAGYSANYSGNSQDYLWPHMSYMWGEIDGVQLGRYACSTEIYGWESYGSTDLLGIGTMCHEFSHVMGILDLYDTDYGGSGGESNHPDEWDIMAGGGHFNYGRTPVGYSLYDRYAMGFAQPQVITEAGDYTLNYIGTSNEGFLLRTPQDKEFFLIENRQRTRWDVNLPGHGMIVARVDSTNTDVWWNNTINANPAHQYYELLRAGNGTGSSSSDPFPGTNNVKNITNYTEPNLLTWAGSPNDFFIENITENNGVIKFSIKADNETQTIVEDFETIDAPTPAGAKGVMGRFWKWDFAKSVVSAPGQGKCNGNHSLAMIKPSAITTAHNVEADIKMMTYTVFNTTSAAVKYTVSLSYDDGATFNVVDEFLADAKNVSTHTLSISLKEPARIRLSQVTGSASTKCYIDDITFKYLGDIGEPPAEVLIGDVNGDGEVSIADVTTLVDLLAANSENERSDVNGDGETSIADVTMLVTILLEQ
ncbi:MAG: M6 family metalloprotease domain-containing protein [Muribaculaceae bacterium]|nr:M6 family metalloprotease domain-containing protein [Muribaculaceae bacterium]